MATPAMSRPIHATISLAALRHNYWVAKRTAQRAKVFAVLKANAYGHGIERASRALDRADGFAMLELDGALALRERMPLAPILLLEGFFEASELHAIASAGLATAVHCEEQLRMLETERPDRPLDIWLKVNTGMNRLGFAPDAVAEALERLKRSATTRSITLMTHFAKRGRRERREGGDAPLRSGHARASSCRAASPIPRPSSRIPSRTPTSRGWASGSTAPHRSSTGPRNRWGSSPR